MNRQVWQWIIQLIIGLAIGLALAFATGWWWWPLETANTHPTVLHRRYQDEYVVLVATTYQVDGDLARARERLAVLHPQNPAIPVIEVGERLIASGGPEQDIQRIAHLAWALDAITPSLMPYLEGGTR